MTATAAQNEDMGLVLRPMVRDDLRAVLRIEQQSPTAAWTRTMFLAELGLKKRRYLTAHLGNKCVGFGGLIAVAGEGHIANLGVDEQFRRQGIATHMMLGIVHAATELDCRALTLEVAVSNHAAQALYCRFGFAPAGIRKNYYSASNEDALVMWAHDTDLDQYRERIQKIQGTLSSVGVGQ
ncbi:MAG: ribosomal protein S18-alanine N-acetyltransferase [Acidimicrobiales bacterium]